MCDIKGRRWHVKPDVVRMCMLPSGDGISPLDGQNTVEPRRMRHPSSPLDRIHTVRRHQAWPAIIALGQHTSLENVRRGMLSLPCVALDRTTSGFRFHHYPKVAHTVGLCRAWIAIINHGCRIHTNLIFLLNFPIVVY